MDDRAEKPMEKIARSAHALAVLALGAIAVAGIARSCRAQASTSNDFVRRDGTRLTLGGKVFRYSGPNIEWLGLEDYGPDGGMGPRYPSHFEVDDALDTAKMMGARVVRSQTMGDSVGCALCIEPREGVFNPRAFRAVDYAIMEAHKRGLRLIITLAGDCSYCRMSGGGEYVLWNGGHDARQFFTDPQVIAAFEAHIRAVLNHKNVYTGIAYKDDPTIMAWENCNVCGLGALGPDFTRNPAPYLRWIDTIGSFIKSIDRNHLYEDNSGFFLFNPRALDARTTDMVTAEYYPHWDSLFGFGHKTTAQSFVKDAALVTGKGKVYVANEFGWDPTDWPTRADLETVLRTLQSDPKISGDGYWALQAHARKFGWQPIPAPTHSASYARWGESGEWWSLYYGGVHTLINTAADMQARAEMLRSHAFAMAGLPVPPYPAPAAPVITFRGIGLVGWRGSAGAVVYTVQRRDPGSAIWKTICDKCATDADTPWVDVSAKGESLAALVATRYRVIAYSADGRASPPSAAR
jgi:hypothetical protein